MTRMVCAVLGCGGSPKTARARYCELHSSREGILERQRERYRTDAAHREKARARSRKLMRELYQRKYGEEGCRQIKIVISSDLYDEVEKRAREMDMSPSQYARAALRHRVKRLKWQESQGGGVPTPSPATDEMEGDQ